MFLYKHNSISINKIHLFKRILNKFYYLVIAFNNLEFNFS